MLAFVGNALATHAATTFPRVGVYAATVSLKLAMPFHKYLDADASHGYGYNDY